MPVQLQKVGEAGNDNLDASRERIERPVSVFLYFSFFIFQLVTADGAAADRR